MSVKPRTIDNLGVEASIRYAKDQEFFEARYIEESRLIPQKTEISVSHPLSLTEFEARFSLGRTLPWALFSPPPEYSPYGKLIFSYQLIPSLGDYEKLDADSDKLERIESVLEREERNSGQEFSDKEKEEREKERDLLVSLFQCINRLNKTLLLINARRNQYQRG